MFAESREDVTLEEAYRRCTVIATSHYENFPVGSLLAPPDRRRSLHAIYAFSRTADDYADEGELGADDRLGRIDEWGRMLAACYEGKADHPVFVALSDTVERFRLPKELFDSLLAAFRQDVTKNRYETFDELLDYCRLSAQPVGRLVLSVFGAENQRRSALSDDLCTALQLANLWQDLSRDLRKDRLYLPLEDLERFGYTHEELRQERFTPDFARMMRFEVDRTKALFRSSFPLAGDVGGRLGMELSLTWQGGMRILTKIEGMNYDVLHRRPRLTNADKLPVLAAAITRRKR